MNRYKLESEIRNTGIAYILLFFAGAHYAYLGRWGTQIFFWLTFGGLGIWWLIDVFRLPGLVDYYNDPIFDELDWIEEKEREEYFDLRDREFARREEVMEERYF